MKRVFTVGVFDYFHIGHLRLFENAKSLGDYLIVAVQDQDFVLKTKPDKLLFYSTEQRVQMIKALRVVDEVIVYQDVDRIIQEVDFEVFAKGPDQVHDGFQKSVRWCINNGKEVIILPRTPGISSSDIKAEWSSARRRAFHVKI